MVHAITREALQAKLDSGRPVVLVEALPRKSYETAHLPGAVNIPHELVGLLAPRLLPDKDADIIVYGAGGPSHGLNLAASGLAGLGYTHIYGYLGGKGDWAAAGLPLTHGYNARPI